MVFLHNTVLFYQIIPLLQFLGYCVDLINREFPHIHVVKVSLGSLLLKAVWKCPTRPSRRL
jgi:hypothetical protein